MSNIPIVYANETPPPPISAKYKLNKNSQMMTFTVCMIQMIIHKLILRHKDERDLLSHTNFNLTQ